MTVRHCLNLLDFSSAELLQIVQRAIELKEMRNKGVVYQPFTGQTLAMIFEKSSTRTRVSFEAGMAEFGGHALFLSSDSTQLGRGEPIADTAKVISRMVHIVMIRNDSQEQLEEFAANSQVPVINALTDQYHPCQLLADVQAYIEHRGSIQGKKVAWIGDGNNVCNSFALAARQFDFELTIASPEGYELDTNVLAMADGHAVQMRDPVEAATNADLIVTDVWSSMGQEAETAARMEAFAPYQVTSELMALAKDDAVFMHCLPAHRGEEVTAEVIDGPQSIVWDEAENRLHAQKALMEFLLNASK